MPGSKPFIELQGAPRSVKAVLGVLRRYANPGHWNTTAENIGNLCGYSQGTVYRVVKWLKDRELLDVTKVGEFAYEYIILPWIPASQNESVEIKPASQNASLEKFPASQNERDTNKGTSKAVKGTSTDMGDAPKFRQPVAEEIWKALAALVEHTEALTGRPFPKVALKQAAHRMALWEDRLLKRGLDAEVLFDALEIHKRRGIVGWEYFFGIVQGQVDQKAVKGQQ